MKAAYDKGDYITLKSLAEREGDLNPEALFYRGVLAENGLGGVEQEIDLKSAEQYYKQAWKYKDLKAGIALARVYHKQHQEGAAKDIYENIVAMQPLEVTPVFSEHKSKSKPIDAINVDAFDSIEAVSIDYAQYRLTRIEAKELLESEEVTEDEVQEIIDRYNQSLYKVSINSKDSTYSKILYHKGMMELKLAEINKAKLTPTLELQISKKLEEEQEKIFAAELKRKRLATKYQDLKKLEMDLNLLKKELSIIDEHNKIVTKITDNARSINEVAAGLEREPDSEVIKKRLRALELERADLSKEYEAFLGKHHEEDFSTEAYEEIKYLLDRNLELLQIRENIENSNRYKQKEKLLLVELDKERKSAMDQVFVVAKSTLEASTHSGYQTAEAELLNIEARELLTRGQNEQAIHKSKEALDLDPNNVNARLIQEKAIEIPDDDRSEAYDRRMALIREVLALEPSNKEALEASKALTGILTGEIASKITIDLLKHTKELASDSRDRFFEKFYDIVATKIENSNYLKNRALFIDIDKISAELSEKLWIDQKENIIATINGKRLEQDRDLKKETKTLLSKWDKTHSSPEMAELSVEERVCLNNRKAFKEKLVQTLEDYYTRCLALTAENSDLTTKKENTYVSLMADGAQYALPLAAVKLDSPLLAGLSATIKAADGAYDVVNKTLLHEAARKFCIIGDRKPKNASVIFERLADDLVEEYGMQIDRLQGISTENLATVAAEKMLGHVRDSGISTLVKSISSIEGIQNTVKDFLSYIGGAGIMQENPVHLLRKGILEGSQKGSRQVELQTIGRPGEDPQGPKWLAHKVFTEPWVTSNGKDIYAKSADVSRTNEYGVKYSRHIPDGYSKKEIVSSNYARYVREDFARNSKINDSTVWLSKEKRQEARIANILDDVEVDEQLLYNSKRNRLFAIGKMIFGAVAIGTAHLIGVAVTLGLAVTTGAIVPIAATAFAIGGISFLSGIKDTYTTSMTIHKVESKRNAQERLKAEGFGDKTKTEALEAAKAKQDERAQAFKEIKEHDIYAVQEKAKQHQELGMWANMFRSKASSGITQNIEGKLRSKAKDARKKVIKREGISFVEQTSLKPPGVPVNSKPVL